jgi:hypothetical protein
MYETTAASRQKYLDTMTLDLDDMAEISGWPVDRIEEVYQRTEALDEATVDEPARFRPYAVAVLAVIAELSSLVVDGAITPEQAAQAFRELVPSIRDVFDGLVTRRYDWHQSRCELVVPEGARIELRSFTRALGQFLTWITADGPS